MIVNDKVLQKLKEPVNEQQYCGTYIKLDRQAFRALRNVYNEANSAARKLLQTPDESELDELNENNINSWGIGTCGVGILSVDVLIAIGFIRANKLSGWYRHFIAVDGAFYPSF